MVKVNISFDMSMVRNLRRCAALLVSTDRSVSRNCVPTGRGGFWERFSESPVLRERLRDITTKITNIHIF